MTPTPIPPTVIYENVTASIGIYLGFIFTAIAAVTALIVAITGAKKAGAEGAKGVLEEQEMRVDRLRKDITAERVDNDALTVKLVATIVRMEVGEVSSRQTLVMLADAQAKALLNDARIIKLETDLTKVQQELTSANRVADERIAELEKENKALRTELTKLSVTYNEAITSWAQERSVFQQKIDNLVTTFEELKKGAK